MYVDGQYKSSCNGDYSITGDLSQPLEEKHDFVTD